MKRVLIFVAIPTHFREMVRVARLLKTSGRYEPRMFFALPYTGWDRDVQTCVAEGIDTLELFSDSFRKAWIFPGGFGQQFMPAVPIQAGPESDERGLIGRLPPGARVFVRRTWRKLYRFLWFARLRLGAVLTYIPRRIWWGTQILKRIGSFLLRVKGKSDKAEMLLTVFAEMWNANILPHAILEKKYRFLALPNFFRAEKIALLVLPEDNHFLETNFYVRAARQNSAASVIVPFTIVNSLEWAETFHGRLAHRIWWPPNFLTAKAFPHWLYEHKGQKMMMPAMQVLLCEHLQLTPPRPWLINSGFADVLAAEAPFMVDYYQQAGIEPERIELTGGLAEDELHARLKDAGAAREELYDRLNLPPGRPMLLVSVPPNQLIGDGRPQCEFSSYKSMMRAVLDVLAECEGWNVVLSLHPRLVHGDLAAAGPHSAKIASDPVSILMPLCEIFVASASTTIRLACAAGKPTINYDVYRYAYTDFVGIPGILTVSDLATFRAAVQSLTRDAARRGDMAGKQLEFATKHALVDGRSGERLLALFDRLTG